MNLIFRPIAEKERKARLGHRHDDIMYSDAVDFLWAKFMCNMWRIVSLSLSLSLYLLAEKNSALGGSIT